MKEKLSIIICHIVFVVTAIVFSVYITTTSSFGASITLDPSLATEFALDGGSFGDLFMSGMSPEGFLIGLDKFYNEDLNPALFRAYGWDINDMLWDPETMGDPLTSNKYDNTVTALSAGAINNTIDAINQGYSVFSTTCNVLGNNAKTFILGKLNQAGDVISSAYDNAVAYIGNNFFNNMSSVRSSLSSDIFNITTSGVYFSHSFSSVQHEFNTEFVYTGAFNTPFIFYSKPGDPTLYGVYVADTLNSGCSASIVRRSNGYTETYSYINTADNYVVSDFTINGVHYRARQIILGSNRSFYCPAGMSSLDEIKTYLGSYSFPDQNASTINISISTTDGRDLSDILGELEGHFVDTSYLSSILDLLNGGIITDSLTGDTVIGLDDTLEGELEGVVGRAIEDSRALDLELASAIDFPIDSDWITPPGWVPDWISNPLAFFLPDEMFDIFEPVFDIVGDNYSMDPMFRMLPGILVIAFVIYFVVSVF